MARKLHPPGRMTIVLKPMSTYVINNRIPRFPIRDSYPDKPLLQKSLEEVFQVWLKERFISNLGRRKACSQLYDFSVWMGVEGRVMETSQAPDFKTWCEREGGPPQSDWGDFLRYARRRVPALAWSELETPENPTP